MNVYIPEKLMDEFRRKRESVPHSVQPNLSRMVQRQMRLWLRSLDEPARRDDRVAPAVTVMDAILTEDAVTRVTISNEDPDAGFDGPMTSRSIPVASLFSDGRMVKINGKD